MSIVNKQTGRMTVPDIIAKKGNEPVVCLTAYTAPMARLLDPHVDIILVGDSMGMVLYGMENTLGVSLEMMIRHGKAVVAASKKALVVIDMPFSSFEESPEQAFHNCARVLAETGAQAVKLEGGQTMAPTIAFLVARGVPVMAHVGLKPQSMNTYGGFKTQGREEKDWQPIIDDAKAVDKAGAFATVIEGVAEPLAHKITGEVKNLTIGIGASKHCDGQIVVSEDMLGFNAWAPKFVKRYCEVAEMIEGAVQSYARDVKSRAFPTDDNVFSMKKKKQ